MNNNYTKEKTYSHNYKKLIFDINIYFHKYYSFTTLIRSNTFTNQFWFHKGLNSFMRIRNVIKYKNIHNLPEFRENTITDLDLLYM